MPEATEALDALSVDLFVKALMKRTLSVASVFNVWAIWFRRLVERERRYLGHHL